MRKDQIGFRTVLVGLLSLLFAVVGNAQELSGFYTYDSNYNYRDLTVPSGYSFLYLVAKGASGGGSNVASAGGEGALVTGYVSIGDGTGEIPVGSTLRFIPGQTGEMTAHGFGGGGGGTGIVFKGPNTSDPWVILMVAGGGGGPGSGESRTKKGKAATTHINGLDGENSDGDLLGNRGVNGSGGTHKTTDPPMAYPGGGVFSDGAGGCPGRAGVLNFEPVGGAGGGGGCADPEYTARGGFGFGGGGSGVGNSQASVGGGGGGGGYSGGGGGATNTESAFHTSLYPGPGGGGGSYANPDYLKLLNMKSFEAAPTALDGYVNYFFSNPKSVHLAKDQTKCFDLANGNTAKGANIQLVQCKGNPAQQWVIEGATIHLAENLNKCIDLTSSNTANGSNIHLWDCNDTDAQHWIYDVANQMIRSKINFNKCIDLVSGNTTGGTNIQLYDCVYTHNQPNQQWIVDGVPSAIPNAKNQRIHLVRNPDKCLDISETYTAADGNNLRLYTCQTTTSQYFTLDGQAIKMQDKPDKCVDLTVSKTDNGKNIRMWDCNGTDAQNWIYDGFTKAFRSAIDLNKCLDVKGSNFTNYTNIQLWDCNGTGAQQFEIY